MVCRWERVHWQYVQTLQHFLDRFSLTSYSLDVLLESKSPRHLKHLRLHQQLQPGILYRHQTSADEYSLYEFSPHPRSLEDFRRHWGA